MNILVENRRARAEYTVLERFEAGLQLTGPEVKSLRLRRGGLVGAHVRVLGGEAILLNAQIPAYEFSRIDEYDPKKTRKLLLHKNEILKLEQSQGTKGLSLIPMKIYVKGRHIKVEVAVARGKKQFERREELRKRDLIREAERVVKTRIR